MNRRSIAGLFVLTVLAPSCGGGGGAPSKSGKAPLPKWQTQQRVPTSSDLRAVRFANLGVGLVAGKDGTIFRTGDGGITWMQENFTPEDRTGDIVALAGQNLRVVAVGSDALGARDWISNDTLTWTTPDVDSSGSPYVDVNLAAGGVGPNDPVDIYRLRRDGTVDYDLRDGTSGSGGTGTWANANGFVNVTSDLLPSHVPPFTFVCGDLGGAGQILKVPVGACPVPGGTKTFRRVVLSSVGQPFACGDDTSNNGIVVHVTNPDPTIPLPVWSAVPSNPGLLPSLQALDFPDQNIGYVVGNNGTIYRLSFNGVATWTWTNQSPGPGVTSEILYAVHFVDKDHGWAVGDKGTVLRTVNGSTVGTWTKMSSGDAGINWNALSFSDDGKQGIAVGNAAAVTNDVKVYRTMNGGATWTAMALPGTLTSPTPNKTLYGVSVPRTPANGTTAYLCGDGGKLYWNTDVWGVGAWVNTGIMGTSVNDVYRAILFPKTGDKGVVVGYNGATPVLLRTANGVTWAAPSTFTGTNPSVAYNALSSNPAGTAVYASGGANSVISVSTDLAGGWNSWGNIATAPGLPPSTTFPAVQSPEGVFFTAMVAAADGNMYRLSPGPPAAGWTSQFGTPWAAAKPVSMAFQSEISGLIVTDAADIYYSIDGGLNWTLTYPHTKANPRVVWMSPTVPGLGYVGCDDGVILKTLTLGH